MKNGFIYELTRVFISIGNYLSLAELFKLIAKKLTSLNPPKMPLTTVPSPESIQNINVAIDIFIVVKWIFVLCVWYNSVNNLFTVLFVWYLLITNLHTYFYYHLWDKRLFSQQSMTEDKQKRRFITSLLAIAFSNLCFAYFYAVPYHCDFEWNKTFDSFFTPLYYSIAKCFANSIEGVKILTSWGNFLSIAQISITFIFVAIILSKSIPQQDNGSNGTSGTNS